MCIVYIYYVNIIQWNGRFVFYCILLTKCIQNQLSNGGNNVAMHYYQNKRRLGNAELVVESFKQT